MKTYWVVVVSYARRKYGIKAESLKEAKELYVQGEYDECEEDGLLNGEVVNTNWEEVK